MMVRGGPNGWIISDLMKSNTTSEVDLDVAVAKGHPVRCSTAMKTNRLPSFEDGNGPVKSTEKESKRLVIRRDRSVLHFGIEDANWHPSHDLT